MVWCEGIICYQTAINAETDTLNAIAPCSLTTRTGHGKPLLTHIIAASDTDDIDKVYVVPSGFPDTNGIPAPYIYKYGATTSIDVEQGRLPIPVEIPENRVLTVYATSATAANSVCVVWLWLEYPNGGKCVTKPGFKAIVKRNWTTGGALTSVVSASATNITTMISGKKYWPAGLGQGGVSGSTAGNVGPAFMAITNPEFEGAYAFVPIVNSYSYTTVGGKGWNDFSFAGLKMPVLDGGNPVTSVALDYTAEQPIANLFFAVDNP
jgi:hypothetical protein